MLGSLLEIPDTTRLESLLPCRYELLFIRLWLFLGASILLPCEGPLLVERPSPTLFLDGFFKWWIFFPATFSFDWLERPWTPPAFLC